MISAFILKALKIVVWPIAWTASKVLQSKRSPLAEPLCVAVCELDMAELIRDEQAKSHTEFEQLHPWPVLKSVRLDGDGK